MAALSIAWSPAPLVSWGKWRTDLAIPMLAGVACFVFVRATGAWRVVVAGLVVGLLLLALLSVFAYVPPTILPPGIPLEAMGGIVRPLPRWYPGPGDASMFAIFCIAPLYVASRGAAASGWRVLSIAAWLLLALVIVTTNNRNALLLAPLVLIAMVVLDRRRGAGRADRSSSRSRRFVVTGAATVIGVVALAAALEWGARERLLYLHKPVTGDSAALELLAADTRPAIWRYYAARGIEHPWLGMGFGRTVPGIGWHTEEDRALAAIEPNAYIHAHNLLLNWWLQLGVVGVLLLVVAAASIARASARLRDRAGEREREFANRLHAAVLVTLTATFARNLTDDFLVYGMATTFCIVIGTLLAAETRRAVD